MATSNRSLGISHVTVVPTNADQVAASAAHEADDDDADDTDDEP